MLKFYRNLNIKVLIKARFNWKPSWQWWKVISPFYSNQNKNTNDTLDNVTYSVSS